MAEVLSIGQEAHIALDYEEGPATGTKSARGFLCSEANAGLFPTLTKIISLILMVAKTYCGLSVF